MIGEKLIRTRYGKGLTVLKLEQLSGVSRVTIIRLEAGAVPTAPTAKKIAEALEVEITDLWTLDDLRANQVTAA